MRLVSAGISYEKVLTLGVLIDEISAADETC